MALTPGTRLGPYEVTAQIGEGGMGGGVSGQGHQAGARGGADAARGRWIRERPFYMSAGRTGA